MRGDRIASGSVRFVLLLIISCASLTLGPAVAGPNGNSENAQACQKGGYETLFRADGTGFSNTGECVSYAARGGTFQAPVVAVLEWIFVPDGTGFDAVLHGEGLLYPSDVAVSIVIDDDFRQYTVPVLPDGTPQFFSADVPCSFLAESYSAEGATFSGDPISTYVDAFADICPPIEF